MSTDHRARRVATLLTTLALAGAPAASATSHDYCNWDGSACSNAANTLYFAQGENFLSNNHAYLVYQPTSPTIFCGAHSGGVQYAGYTSGNPGCNHTYGGGTSLKADEFVNVAATTHGVITY